MMNAWCSGKDLPSLMKCYLQYVCLGLEINPEVLCCVSYRRRRCYCGLDAVSTAMQVSIVT